MVTTVGQLLLRQIVPKDLHDDLKEPLVKKTLGKLLQKVYDKHPSEYGSIVGKLTTLGFHTASRLGSSAFLEDMLSPIDKDAEYKKLRAELKTSDDKHKGDEVERKKARGLIFHKFTEDINKRLLDEGLKKNQTLAIMVASGSRASPAQYRQTIFSPVLVDDKKGRANVDMPLQRGFAEGLHLPEYLTTLYSSRDATVSTKLAIADTGALTKELSRGTMHLQVEEHDCGTDNGVPIHTDEKEYIGSFLAHPVDVYKKNNEITPKLLADLQNKKITNIVVRNPITCESSRHHHYGAVCQLCAGKREKGLPELGNFIGLIAASGIGESISQGALSKKHSAGSSNTQVSGSGYEVIKQVMDIPETFRSKAAVALEDGTVTDIKDLAQGGKGLYVNGKEYYLAPGIESKVKIGDKVEAGDIMSDGIPDPREIVEHKGIGEGRLHFSRNLKSIMDSRGMGGVHKKNFDAVSRAVIDHVEITDPEGLGDHLPGSVISYQTVEKDYHARPDSKLVRVDLALGKYLERPVLHYTIGTKLNHRMIAELRNNRIESVLIHENPPGFKPHMVRLNDIPSHVPDWMTQLYATNIEGKLLSAVNEGATSDVEGFSAIPGMAYGSIRNKHKIGS